MRWLLVLALCACRGGPSGGHERVPASWRVARLSAGHLAHVGKVPCSDCHGDGFRAPPLEICTRCHAPVTALHRNDATARTPTCHDCHDFAGNPAVTAWGCMRCHGDVQGHVPAVGAHADQPCGECHRPHHAQPTAARACTECHPDRETRHAGLHGCRDCHGVHEPARTTLATAGRISPGGRCERCHARQSGALRVDAHAFTAGHVDCTTCHAPHAARGIAARPCADCHAGQPVLAATGHSCLGCHAPHDGGAAKPCASCHHEQVVHPTACASCHPPHDRARVVAVACESCHRQPTHASAACRDCHAPHAGTPVRSVALCTRCHGAEGRRTAGTGHAQCATCHTGSVHGAQVKPPPCASCHARETASAPPGHATCAACHQPHAPRAVAQCASCHARQATAGHGPRVACERCHRAHGPGGVAAPPACASCHARTTLAGLHQSPTHATCTACHRGHEPRPRDDRAACIACHVDRTAHEPGAARCAGCHPFR